MKQENKPGNEAWTRIDLAVPDFDVLQSVDELVNAEGFQLIVSTCITGREYFIKLRKCQAWRVTSIKMNRTTRILIGGPREETVFDSEEIFKECRSTLAVERAYEARRDRGFVEEVKVISVERA